jgi:hypothetical protein
MCWWSLLLLNWLSGLSGLRAWGMLRMGIGVETTGSCSVVRTAARGTIISRGRWGLDLAFFNRCRRGVPDGRQETSNAASALFYESLLLLLYGDHGSNLFDCIGIITLKCKAHYDRRDRCGSGLFWLKWSNIDLKGLTAYGYTPLFWRWSWRGRRRRGIVEFLFYANGCT